MLVNSCAWSVKRLMNTVKMKVQFLGLSNIFIKLSEHLLIIFINIAKYWVQILPENFV